MSFQDLLDANTAYAAAREEGLLPGGAKRGLAVVTCMDSRIDPLAVLGLQPGDAIILRTPAGRVTDDVLNSLVIAATVLGVDRVLVMPHTQCKMTQATDEDVRSAITERTGVDASDLPIGTIRDADATLAQDLARIADSPYLQGVPVSGAVLDLETGALGPLQT